MRAVGRMLRASPDSVLLGADASERRPKAMRLTDYRVIHLATRALVADETAVFSAHAEPAPALSLPAAPNGDDDGLLTAARSRR